MLALSKNKLYERLELKQPIHPRYFTPENLKYFDKDGFELTPLERVIYDYHAVPINDHLNNHCNQLDWFVQKDNPVKGVVLDHAMILHRFAVGGLLREQLERVVDIAPVFHKILQIKPKWGLDFNLDYYDELGPLELFHVEFDTRDYEEAYVQKTVIENFILSMDWMYVVERLRATEDEWKNLSGMKQNDWKAKFLGFDKAEQTQKAW